MSMDQPNEYEQAIEIYALAVHRESRAKANLENAQEEDRVARFDRQEKWRIISAFVNEGKIKPGIYKLRKGPGLYQDGILIEEHHDYPEIFPMFR